VGTNNQLVGYQYDIAGNMMNDGSHNYTYDAENRISQVDGGTTATYVYNESGQRVRKATGSTWTEYFYAPDGKVLSDYNGTGYPKEYIYAGDRLVAQYNWLTGTTNFIHADHLGTTRVVTAVNQSVLDSLDFYPYGQQSSGDTTTTHKFTGKERDSESGLDYFGARYDASSMDRFMTPDPLPWPHWQNGSRDDRKRFAELLTNPQNLNMYSYVRNNPLNSVDPDGMDVYVVAYTTGNSQGDDELKRAAQTKKDEITSSKGFDPKKDTVIIAGVKTKEDFQSVLNSAANLGDKFGKTTNVSLFSHAGDIDGPVFHDASGHATQFTQSELSNLKVNWGANSAAAFYGCSTADNFAQHFANAQSVRSFGFLGGVDFSGRSDSVSKWYVLSGQWDRYMVDKGEKGLQERDPQ
jgi:RHS repeat-associated protein